MMPDLMSGQVPIGVVSALAGVSQARGGKIRALAVTSAQRLPNAPESRRSPKPLPASRPPRTYSWWRRQGSRSDKLSNAVRAAVTSPDVQESFAKQGATPMPAQPGELAARIAAETRRWAAVVKDAGIKAE